MPDFARPEFLLLLPLAVLAAWWQLRRRRAALRFPDLTLLDGLPTGRAGLVRWGGAVLRGVVFAALALALANPRRPDLKTQVPVDGIAIALVTDVSGSMGEPVVGTTDGKPLTRLTAAKQAFRLFVAGGTAPDGVSFDGRPNDQIALVTFAVVPHTTCPLTLNHSVLLRVMDEQKPLDGINAGTNIGDALAEAAIRLLAAGDRPKVIVLLSDGEHNKEEGAALLPTQTARLLELLQVPVYAIDCGGDNSPGTPDEQKQRADGRAILEAVATVTGGKSFVADSGEELRAVLKELDGRTKVPAPAPRYRRYHEYGPWCGLAALLAFAALALLEQTRWRTIP